MSFSIPRAAQDAMVARAEADYPEETCGFAFEIDGELRVQPMKNCQNELHTEDPVAFPRDARTAYYFDPGEMQRVLEANEQAGNPLKAIYHSHPDHEAYFSETDSAAAAPFGEPSYPGVIYIVLSVKGGQFAGWKAFDWSDEAAAYVEIPLRVTT